MKYVPLYFVMMLSSGLLFCADDHVFDSDMVQECDDDSAGIAVLQAQYIATLALLRVEEQNNKQLGLDKAQLEQRLDQAQQEQQRLAVENEQLVQKMKTLQETLGHQHTALTNWKTQAARFGDIISYCERCSRILALQDGVQAHTAVSSASSSMQMVPFETHATMEHRRHAGQQRRLQ